MRRRRYRLSKVPYLKFVSFEDYIKNVLKYNLKINFESTIHRHVFGYYQKIDGYVVKIVKITNPNGKWGKYKFVSSTDSYLKKHNMIEDGNFDAIIFKGMWKEVTTSIKDVEDFLEKYKSYIFTLVSLSD